MKWRRAVAVLMLAVSSAGHAQPCQQRWLPEFASSGINNTVWSIAPSQVPGVPGLVVCGHFYQAGAANGGVVTWSEFGLTQWSAPLGPGFRCQTYFDFDGTGPQPARLVLGGTFSLGGTRRVAAWNGSGWEGIGTINFDVLSLAAYDDGTGPALYAGMNDHCLKWTGTEWADIATNVAGNLFALAVFDEDGAGPARPNLFIGGIAHVNGVPFHGIARWDGTALTPVGGGLTGGSVQTVYTLNALDPDGPGSQAEALYVGGNFTAADGLPAACIATWSGSAWAALGSGVAGGSTPSVWTIARADEDGDGPLPPGLIVGGDFTFAGGIPTKNTARWRNGAWTALTSTFNGPVRTLCPNREGDADVVYAGGEFTSPGIRFARLSDSTWRTLGNDVTGIVYSLAAVETPSGPELWAGGDFTAVGGGSVTAGKIAAWTGQEWHTLAGGVNGTVHAITQFDDGTGMSPYIAGAFTLSGGTPAANAALFDGHSWQQLGGGVNGIIRAAAMFDEDGTGPNPPALFIGGAFTSAGGNPINYLARWNGTSFSQVGGVLAGPFAAPGVYDIKVWNDGSGPALYVCGGISVVGELAIGGIAKWDGTSWSSLAGGTGQANLALIQSMEVFDDGTGQALYVGGRMWSLGEVPVGPVAKWNGAAWSNVGTGTDWAINAGVNKLIVFNEPGGQSLIAGGGFSRVDGVSFNGIARWRNGAWTPVGDGFDSSSHRVNSMAVSDNGASLYVVGQFPGVGSVSSPGILRWNGTAWGAVGTGLSGSGNSVCEFDGGAGPRLYIGGTFSTFPGFSSPGLVRWNGNAFDNPGSVSGGASSVTCVMPIPMGVNTALLIGGSFATAGVVSNGHIARWDGAQWLPLGGGADGLVYAMCAMDDGSGPALYAGGSFTTIGGVQANRVARWDGREWTALGSGTSGAVYSLCAFNDGNGPALYVGGYFQNAGGLPVYRIARWRNGKWSALGQGISGGLGVNAMAVFTDASSTALYVGGDFTSASPGAPSPFLAKWNGTTWSSLPGTIAGGGIAAMSVLQDATGQQLYIGGGFATIGGNTMNHIARWDGASWSSLGSGTLGSTYNGVVFGLAAFQDNTSPALFAGGSFATAGGASSVNLARWGCTGARALANCYPNCDGSTAPPILNANDFVCFLNNFAIQGSYTNCDHSTFAPVLNANDFQCFLNTFAAGCP